MNNSNEINNLELLFSRLPGLGPRSARRIVLYLLKKKDTLMPSLTSSLTLAMKSIVSCSSCGNIDIADPCSICEDSKRDHKIICVVEDITDLWALQKVNTFKGLFHILGGVLSALDGIGPKNLRIDELINRVKENNVNEVILALPVEGGVAIAFKSEIENSSNPDIKRKELEELLAKRSSPFPRSENFSVHELIDPRETRIKLISWLELAVKSQKTDAKKFKVTMRP